MQNHSFDHNDRQLKVEKFIDNVLDAITSIDPNFAWKIVNCSPEEGNQAQIEALYLEGLQHFNPSMRKPIFHLMNFENAKIANNELIAEIISIA